MIAETPVATTPREYAEYGLVGANLRVQNWNGFLAYRTEHEPLKRGSGVPMRSTAAGRIYRAVCFESALHNARTFPLTAKLFGLQALVSTNESRNLNCRHTGYSPHCTQLAIRQGAITNSHQQPALFRSPGRTSIFRISDKSSRRDFSNRLTPP